MHSGHFEDIIITQDNNIMALKKEANVRGVWR